MTNLMQIAAACLSLIGGITLFVALFTPRRFTAKRPQRFFTGAGCLAIAGYLYYVAGR